MLVAFLHLKPGGSRHFGGFGLDVHVFKGPRLDVNVIVVVLACIHGLSYIFDKNGDVPAIFAGPALDVHGMFLDIAEVVFFMWFRS